VLASSQVRTLDEVIEKSNAAPCGLAIYALMNSTLSAEMLFGGLKESGVDRKRCDTVIKNVSHLDRTTGALI
jgi:hypothetical protein